MQPLQNLPSNLGHIIDGKRVLGAPDEIQEVKNAIEAYRLMPELDAFKEKDLLKAHGLIMKDLVKQAGHYRQDSCRDYCKRPSAGLLQCHCPERCCRQ